jgi:hypothetical protein
VIAAAREAYLEAREKFYREIIDAKRDDSEIERLAMIDDERDARAECERRGIDPDEDCADGGIVAWQVVCEELRRSGAKVTLQ